MKFERKNTIEARENYDNMDFKMTDSEIRNPDGSVVFSAKNIEIPEDWSQVAADVLAQKYFRKVFVLGTIFHSSGKAMWTARTVFVFPSKKKEVCSRGQHSALGTFPPGLNSRNSVQSVNASMAWKSDRSTHDTDEEVI